MTAGWAAPAAPSWAETGRAVNIGCPAPHGSVGLGTGRAARLGSDRMGAARAMGRLGLLGLLCALLLGVSAASRGAGDRGRAGAAPLRSVPRGPQGGRAAATLSG